MPIWSKKENITSIPNNSYYVSKKDKKERYEQENHVIKTPSGLKNGANKIANDIFVYAPKGLKGSVNSNFHEFLSLGAIPYIAGSGTLIALYNLANKYYEPTSQKAADTLGRKMALGVGLYAVGKWLGGKVMDKSVKILTGIDRNLTYKKIIPELPEYAGDKPKTSTEFHKVYESVDFPRWDLIEAKSEYEKGHKYSYYDKIAKKMGYKEKLNAPDQAVQGAIQEVLVKSSAAKNISSYLWAAVGVAYAFQPAFDILEKIGKPLDEGATFLEQFGKKDKIKIVINKMQEAAKTLWKGNGKKYSGIFGKALILSALGSTIFGAFNTLTSFRAKAKNDKAEIKPNKNYGEY